MIAADLELVPQLAMLLLLVAVGWGIGLAGAIARRSVQRSRPLRLRVSSPVGVCLATAIGGSALGAYALVLHAVGLLSC